MARWVTVGAIAWEKAAGVPLERGLEEAGELLRQAATAHPDLVIFQELFLHQDWPIARQRELTLPNAVTDYFGALAREYHTNLAVPMPVMDDGRCYNSVVVLDRQGAIVGRYDKVHPTPGELAAGVTPGAGPVVVSLDIGRIAFAICFDLNFLTLAEELQARDVDLVCVPTMFTGADLLTHWALTTGAYVLSAYHEDSRLIDMTGRELQCIGQRYEAFHLWRLAPILTARLNFDRRLFHVDYNVADYDGRHGGVHRLLAECADRITIDHNLLMSLLAIGALDGVTLEELVQRYGLIPRNAFFASARREIAQASAAAHCERNT